MNYIATMRIIMSFFTSPELFITNLIKGEFGKLIAKYYSLDVLYQFNQYKNVSTILNPDAILNILKKSTDLERKRLLADLDKMTKAQKEQAIKQLDLSKPKTKLSSSWVQYGSFNQYKNSVLGNLTIWVKSDTDPKHRWYGPYTYPAIENDIWSQMLSARGKNGTGAGSVMWRTFLRQWLPSELRNFVVDNKETFNQQSLRENKALIEKLAKNHARNKTPGGQETKYWLNTGRSVNDRNLDVIRKRIREQKLQQSRDIRSRIKDQYAQQKAEILKPYIEAKRAKKEAYKRYQAAYKQAPASVKKEVKRQINNYEEQVKQQQAEVENATNPHQQSSTQASGSNNSSSSQTSSNSATSSNGTSSNSSSSSSSSSSGSGESKPYWTPKSKPNQSNNRGSTKPKKIAQTQSFGDYMAKQIRDEAELLASAFETNSGNPFNKIGGTNRSKHHSSSRSKSTRLSSSRPRTNSKSVRPKTMRNSNQQSPFVKALKKHIKKAVKKTAKDIWNQRG